MSISRSFVDSRFNCSYIHYDRSVQSSEWGLSMQHDLVCNNVLYTRVLCAHQGKQCDVQLQSRQVPTD